MLNVNESQMNQINKINQIKTMLDIKLIEVSIIRWYNVCNAFRKFRYQSYPIPEHHSDPVKLYSISENWVNFIVEQNWRGLHILIQWMWTVTSFHMLLCFHIVLGCSSFSIDQKLTRIANSDWGVTFFWGKSSLRNRVFGLSGGHKFNMVSCQRARSMSNLQTDSTFIFSVQTWCHIVSDNSIWLFFLDRIIMSSVGSQLFPSIAV